jgi:hypothetical protein
MPNPSQWPSQHIEAVLVAEERCRYVSSSLYKVKILIFDADGKIIAYFRGRKLHGKAIKIPKGYRGVVLSTTDRILPKPQPKELDEEDEEEFNEVKIVEEEATFDEFMIWGHEALPEELADPYVRGMEEWMDFAQTVCYGA